MSIAKTTPLSQLIESSDLKLSLPAQLKELAVSGICFDSRTLKKGDIFFALSGAVSDGNKFVLDAVKKGAVAVFSEQDLSLNVPSVQVSSAREALARISGAYFDNPSSKLLSIGITGTNGKTTLCSLISQSLAFKGTRVVSSGTLGSYFWSSESEPELLEPLENTTPDPVTIHRTIQQGLDSGAEAFISEVSSHGLVQQRTLGISWDLALFTNFSQDHLDYHETFEDYFSAKSLLFSKELGESGKSNKIAVLNIDDPRIEDLRMENEQAGAFRTISFSENSGESDVFLERKRVSLQGLELDVRIKDKSKLSLRSSLAGDYNVSNLLALVAVLHGLGWSESEITDTVPMLQPVPGRLERVQDPDKAVFVDYAHTPDALSRVCATLKSFSQGRLIVVFGCGGDRDRTKRPLMAKVVEELADIAMVTSDNPRTEDPEFIISEIVKGLSADEKFRYFVQVDRREAIKEAIGLAQAGDTILVAGKGHEDYQEIDGIKNPFDDRMVIKAVLKELSSVSGV